MTQKEDPRAIRTQEMLKAALISLLQTGVQMHQLSVQKVTKEAGLNRTTFYLHYQDLEDLKQAVTDDILQGLTENMEGLGSENDHDRHQQLVQFLDYIYAQRSHLLVLFQFEEVEAHLFNLMKDLIVIRRSKSTKPKRKIYIDPDIRTASIVGIIMWWMKNGLHLSSEHIATQIQLLFS